MKVPSNRRRNSSKIPNRGFIAVRSFLPLTIYLETGVTVNHLTEQYFHTVDKWLKSEGKVSAVKRLKNTYLQALRSLVGNPIVVPFTKTNKRGFPSSFAFLETFYRSQGQTPQAMQAVLSIMGYYRNILAPGIPDLNPITDQGPNIPSSLIDEIIELGFDPNWIIKPKELDPVKIALRSKVGPNGQATISSMLDLSVLTDGLVEDLIFMLSRHDDEDNIRSTLPMLRTKSIKGLKAVHSRLAIKREKGGKDRVFAMVDYWTQIILKPLHTGLSRILKEIPEDCTYNQSKGLDQMKQWTLEKSAVSKDLTSASDRFPIQLQKAVLEKLTGCSEFAQSWSNLMVDREFIYKNKSYKWTVGQPLGAHSSWPSFALAHHIVMRAAYKKANISHHKNYLLLGDDMAAVNSEAIPFYCNYLQQLGVLLSDTKGLDGNSCEFAKRVFHNGYEVSPIPVPMLETLLKDKFLLPEFLTKVRERSTGLQFDLRVSIFLDQLSDKLGWDREELSILAEYPLPQMRHILETKAPSLEEVMLESVIWNGHLFSRENIWEEFNDVRFSHLICQLDEMTRSGRTSMARLNQLELPATPTGIRRMHPIFTAFGNYFDEIESARKEVRGFLASRDRWAEVPLVHLTNVTTLLKGSIKGSRHSGKLLLEVYKRLVDSLPEPTFMNDETTVTPKT